MSEANHLSEAAAKRKIVGCAARLATERAESKSKSALRKGSERYSESTCSMAGIFCLTSPGGAQWVWLGVPA